MARLATFRSRLALTMLAFALLAELVVAAAILHTTYRHTMAQAHRSIAVGERVLNEFMAARTRKLQMAAGMLAADTAFRSAVAANDASAVRTALSRLGDRIGADIAVLVGGTGQIDAAVFSAGATGTLPFAELLARAQRAGNASGLVAVDNRAYQFVMAPVRMPRRTAWVGMGYAIDRTLARDLAELTGLVAFVVSKNGNTLFRVDTLPATPNQPASAAVEDAFVIDRYVVLDAGGARLEAVLGLERSQIMAGYYDLARNLLLILSATLLVSALAAAWLGRKISEPVHKLSRFAESVAAGQYIESPQTRDIGELDVLSKALNEMQTAVQSREKRIRHQALHDPLTGLPNRESMRRILEQYLRERRQFAAVRLAIQGFARINGALGYQLADQVLQAVSDRLRAAFHAQQPIGRIEGNDFLVLLECGANTAALDLEIEHIRACVEKPVQLLDTEVTLTLEIGVVTVPQLADDIETVWRRSVIARNHSRDENGRTFYYQAGMDEARIRELTIIRDLAPALQNNELEVVYQPKMVLNSGAVCQVEALSRWVHPELGPIPPDEFVGLAERSGQVNLLTHWLVNRLTAQIKRWRTQGLPLGVALNLSADELADEHLADMIAPLLDAASPEQRITLEVTESALLRDPATALAHLHHLQAMGARIAIDDFGAGYSSLAQLKQLGVNELKIDKSLVLKLDTTPADQSIVQMIIDLGHKLGLEVVAEGVENAATWRYLVEHGADIMQGYFLARPMEAEKLDAWLRNHNRDESRWCARTVLGPGVGRPWRHLNS